MYHGRAAVKGEPLKPTGLPPFPRPELAPMRYRGRVRFSVFEEQTATIWFAELIPALAVRLCRGYGMSASLPNTRPASRSAIAEFLQTALEDGGKAAVMRIGELARIERDLLIKAPCIAASATGGDDGFSTYALTLE